MANKNNIRSIWFSDKLAELQASIQRAFEKWDV